MKYRIPAMSAALFAAVIAHGPAFGAPETATVTLGMTSSSVFLNAFVAKDRGYFTKHGLDVKI